MPLAQLQLPAQALFWEVALPPQWAMVKLLAALQRLPCFLLVLEVELAQLVRQLLTIQATSLAVVPLPRLHPMLSLLGFSFLRPLRQLPRVAPLRLDYRTAQVKVVQSHQCLAPVAVRGDRNPRTRQAQDVDRPQVAAQQCRRHHLDQHYLATARCCRAWLITKLERRPCLAHSPWAPVNLLASRVIDHAVANPRSIMIQLLHSHYQMMAMSLWVVVDVSSVARSAHMRRTALTTWHVAKVALLHFLTIGGIVRKY